MDKRERNRQIAEETVQILQKGEYSLSGKVIRIRDVVDRAVQQSVLYKSGHVFSVENTESHSPFTTIFDVKNESTLTGAKELVDKGYARVGVLNFASAKHPGGGFLKGSSAQEESIARSSALYSCLTPLKEMYTFNARAGSALYSDYMIYSPDVPVFRNEQGSLMENPFLVSIITSPAVNAKVVKEQEKSKIKEIVPVMRQRIEKILDVAVNQQMDALVLGAFGCGVFENNPYDVVKIFQDLLYKNPKFKNKFKHVRFSVLDQTPTKMTFNMFKNGFR